MSALRRLLLCVVLIPLPVRSAAARQAAPGPRAPGGDSVLVRLADADLRTAIQALSQYLSRPLLQNGVPQIRITFETPAPVPRAAVLPLLRGLVETYGLELVEEPAFYRVRPRPAPERAVQTPPDVPPASRERSSEVRLYVLRLRHARASDVAATVTQLYGGAGVFSGSNGLSSGTLSDDIRRDGAVGPGGPAGPAGTPAAPGGAPGTLRGSVTVVPDDITNALLIRASEADYELLRAAVDELDIRPLQVLIEVLIVEARTDRSFNLGTDLFVPDQRVGSGNTTAGGSVTGGGLGDLVIRVLNLGSGNVNATIRAAASRGDVRIVSRPVLLASNNTEARLLVGSQRPFVQVSRSLPTDAPTRDQVVQYRDVGTRLLVRPTINQEGYVSLQVQQEVNAATAETQFDAPIISTREAATRVLVRDGQTVVLGGLRDQQRDRSSGGVPVLSSIPLLGGLFGRTSTRTSGTELYLFLTPRILRTDADADSATVRRMPHDVQP